MLKLILPCFLRLLDPPSTLLCHSHYSINSVFTFSGLPLISILSEARDPLGWSCGSLPWVLGPASLHHLEKGDTWWAVNVPATSIVPGHLHVELTRAIQVHLAAHRSPYLRSPNCSIFYFPTFSKRANIHTASWTGSVCDGYLRLPTLGHLWKLADFTFMTSLVLASLTLNLIDSSPPTALDLLFSSILLGFGFDLLKYLPLLQSISCCSCILYLTLPKAAREVQLGFSQVLIQAHNVLASIPFLSTGFPNSLPLTPNFFLLKCAPPQIFIPQVQEFHPSCCLAKKLEVILVPLFFSISCPICLPSKYVQNLASSHELSAYTLVQTSNIFQPT